MTRSSFPRLRGRSVRDLLKWAEQLQQHFDTQEKSGQRIEGQPIQLTHRRTGDRALADGLLMYDPVNGYPVISKNGVYVPLILQDASGNSAPVNQSAPIISPSTVYVGADLSVTDGGWLGVPAPTFTYQWQRDGVDISGETSGTYTTVGADVGADITCDVTATNSEGSATATSNVAEATGAPQWIMAAGVWDDAGIWDDSDQWNDA